MSGMGGSFVKRAAGMLDRRDSRRSELAGDESSDAFQTASIYRKTTRDIYFKDGDMFGEVSIINKKPVTATIMAVSHCDLTLSHRTPCCALPCHVMSCRAVLC